MGLSCKLRIFVSNFGRNKYASHELSSMLFKLYRHKEERQIGHPSKLQKGANFSKLINKQLLCYIVFLFALSVSLYYSLFV
jgi:hypothetical protein